MSRARLAALVLLASCSPAHPDPTGARPPDARPAEAGASAAGASRPPPSGAEEPRQGLHADVEPHPLDAGAPDAAQANSPAKVKIVTIGMHVAGGPFDEPTKEPFKKSVEPTFPRMAACWAKHVPQPPKSIDVGVDLLIEPSGGTPRVSYPRSTLPGLGKGVATETAAFVPCVIEVFESVTFPDLAPRGRTGVSYSLRFTTR